MPLLKTSDRDLVRIDLPENGEWIEVKRALGKDDEREIQRRLLTGQLIRQGEPLREFDAGAAIDMGTFATLEVACKRWSFKEALTAANLRALDDASLAVIIERLNELYPAPLTEDEAKNSSGAGAPQSLAVVQSQNDLAG